MKEYEFSDKIMGTELNVSIIAENEEDAKNGYEEVLIIAKEYEAKFSRFNKDSELSQLNTEKTKKVSEEFLLVTKIAGKLYEDTENLFNPLLQVEKIGYDESFEKIKDRKSFEKDSGLINTKMDEIKIIESESKIILDQNQKLDFGGFLKGYVSEIMCKKLSEKFKGVIVNLGGDIFTTGLDENQENFIFVIENPIDKSLSIKVPLRDSSMATSGNYKRKWKINNETISHIVDKSGKNPKTDLISATILSEHGHLAEGFATAALCLNSKEAKEFLDKKNISYLLITKDGEILTNLTI